MTSLIRTAIALKEKLDALPNHSKPIGYVVNLIQEEEVDQDDDGRPKKAEPVKDSEPVRQPSLDRERSEALRETVEAWSKRVFKGSFGKRSAKARAALLTVRINDEPVTFTKDNFETMYAKAEPSSFGDNKALKTTYDDKVRRSREFDKNIEVSPKLLRYVQRAWATTMCPKATATVNKIVMYKDGDFFSKHKDTPDKNLVGTMWVHLLMDTMKRWNPVFKVFANGDCDDEGTETAYAHDDYCGFYTDVMHEVPRLDAEYRVTVTFKMYVSSEMHASTSVEDEQAQRVVDELQKWQRPFGVLFSHQYALEDTEAKGTDSVFARAITKLGTMTGVACETLSVMVTYKNTWEYDETVKPGEASVFRVVDEEKTTPHDTAAMKTKKKRMRADSPQPHTEGIPFMWLSENGYVWHHEHDSAAEHTGNQSEPGNVNSVYLHRAVIVR